MNALCGSMKDASQAARASAMESHHRLTFRFRSLSFLIRRAVHSPAVAPLLNSSLGFLAAASAISLLFSTSGRRTTSLFGRVKNATEYRS